MPSMPFKKYFKVVPKIEIQNKYHEDQWNDKNIVHCIASYHIWTYKFLMILKYQNDLTVACTTYQKKCNCNRQTLEHDNTEN